MKLRALSGGRGRSFVAIIALFTLCITSVCPFPSAGVFAQEGILPPAKQKAKLSIELSEGKTAAEKVEAVKVASTRPLTPERVERILDRLPPWQPATHQPFTWPEQSLVKPKLPGSIKQEPFPPRSTDETPQKPEKPVAAPLKVQRFGPVGKINEATDINITFSQPMVPIGAIGVVNDRKNMPSVLKPEPKGQWRWAGTQTLLFEPSGGKLPRSTNYTVEIPKGVASVSGNKLENRVTWSISTPIISVDAFEPGESAATQDATPIMVAVFSQPIDQAAVLKAIKVTAAGRAYAVRLATADEIKKESDENPYLKSYTRDKSFKGRVLVFRAQERLPLASTILVTFGPGVPSREGPLKSAKAQQFKFNTYGKFNLVGFPKGVVSPDQWQSRDFFFSNAIDKKKLKLSMLTVSPSTPSLTWGTRATNVLTLDGRLKARTRYVVTIDGSLADKFGQTLGAPRKVTFTTGDFQPNIESTRHRFTVIPNDKSKMLPFDVRGMGQVRVRIYAASPTDYYDFVHREYDYANQRKPFKKTALVNKLMPVDPQSESGLSLNLAPYLKNGFGNLVIEVESLEKDPEKKLFVSRWIQFTGIGLDVFQNYQKLLVQASALKDGRPLPGVQLKLLPQATTVATDADGKGEFTLNNDRQNLIVATSGSDVAFIPATDYDSTWQLRTQQEQVRWYHVTDRNLYKPGEKLNVKGWVRQFKIGSRKESVFNFSKYKKVAYSAHDSQGTELFKGAADVDQYGGFSFSGDIPKNVNLGVANIHVAGLDITGAQDGDESGNVSNIGYEIQEFRRPEFELSVKSSEGTSLKVRQKTSLTAQAKYFSGGALSGTPLTWSVSGSRGNYTPPGWSEFVFGDEPFPFPWLREGGAGDEIKTNQFKGITDSAGQHVLDLKVNELDEPVAHNLDCEATVIDVNRQSWSDKVTLLVHPGDVYTGLKLNRYFYHKGDTVECRFVVTDIDGTVMPNRKVNLKITKDVFDVTTEKSTAKLINERELVSGSEPATFSFVAEEGGSFKFAALIKDDVGRASRTTVSTWVQDETTVVPKNVEEEQVHVIADKKEYQPGDVAELMILTPFAPSHGLVTWRREGLVKVEPISLNTTSGTIKVPITEDFIPNLNVQIDLHGANTKYASGSENLKVSTSSRRLTLEAQPAESTLSPGGTTSISLKLKDDGGKPVAGQIALAVVDESLLALTGYKWPDPIESFYMDVEDGVDEIHSRMYALIVADKMNQKQLRSRRPADEMSSLPPPSLPPPPMPGSPDMAKGSAPPPPPLDEQHKITVRKLFDALALFAPDIRTGADGTASVELKLPDSLTRYRIMAVGVSGTYNYGIGESIVTARLPLMVKPSAPRFLNFGDSCQLPIVIQNQTEKALAAEVVLEVNNAVLTGPGLNNSGASTDAAGGSQSAGALTTPSMGYEVEVPANQRVEVRFPMSTLKVGVARFRTAAVSGTASDAQVSEFPVKMPASLESFAAYGQIDNDPQLQIIERPANVFPQIGGLNVTTSSTAMQALTDAFFYLKNYDLGCTEQITSRMLAMLSLKDVLFAFNTIEPVDKDRIGQWLRDDLATLLKRQNADGSFGLWRAGEPTPWPYVSIQAARALALARSKDLSVPDEAVVKSQNYLKNIRKHIPKEYPESAKLSLEAYTLYVRKMLKDVDTASARRVLYATLGSREQKPKGAVKPAGAVPDPLAGDRLLSALPVETAGWLLNVLSKDSKSTKEVTAIRNFINAKLHETASTASVNSDGYSDFDYCLFYSPRRADAIVLEALIEDQPDNDVIPKLVKGLLAHRKQGKWQGTQENAYVLIALERYFSRYEKATPDFVTQVWLGETLAGRQEFKGRSTESRSIDIPMSALADRKDREELLVTKDGAGRLYYRVGLDYASTNLKLQPSSNGFAVSRTYESVDDPKDVQRLPDGTWKIKPGATVRVKLSFSAPSTRYHVALMDPLPGGFEPVNSELKGNRVLFPEEPVEEIEPEVSELPQDTLSLPPPSGLPPPPLPGSPGTVRINNTPNLPPLPESGSAEPAPPPPEEIEQPAFCCIPWWIGTWFDHQNLRDHQAEAFAAILWGGSYNYSYLARATTYGTFMVPPPKVEEMYMPETFGRGSTEKVVIE